MSGILLLLSMAKKGNDMKIAIIGTGNIAHKMAETILQIKGGELYAVISRNIIDPRHLRRGMVLLTS